MKISACVIVKNEAKNLPKWLESMRHIADEMIVADTGSKDSTKDVAAAAGAKVYDFAWKDDFAAAKNFALSRASGDWILFFDADEYFSGETAVLLKKILSQYLHDEAVEAFLCKLINIDTDNDNCVLSSFYQLRIFKNKKNFAYVGAIHEELRNNGKSLKIAALPDKIYARHTGYSASGNAEKHRRNLRLLNRQIRLHGENPKLYPYLATSYFGLGDYEKAVFYLRKFIKSGIKMIGAEVYVYVQYLNALELAHHSHEEIEQVLDDALRKYPQTPDFYYKKGIVSFDANKFTDAEKSLKKALQLYENKNQLTASKLEGLLFVLYGILAKINVLKKNNLQAIKYYISSLQKNRYSEFAEQFCRLLRAYSLPVKIKLIDKIYAHNDKELQFLLSVLQQNDAELFLYYRKFSPASLMENEKKLDSYLAKKYENTAESTAKALDGIYKKLLVYRLKNHEALSAEDELILPEEYQGAFLRVRDKTNK